MVNRAVLRSTVDSRWWRPEWLAGARLAGAAEPGSSPWVGEKEGSYGGSSPRALVAS
jgi:hypothetical protein